jgi:hypothetical protein
LTQQHESDIHLERGKASPLDFRGWHPMDGLMNKANMRFRVLILLDLILMTSMVCADEKLPALKVGNVTYSNVTVIKVSATDIFFVSDKGMANAKLKDLDPALQNHFHYDAAKAAGVEQEQKAATARYRLPVINATNRSVAMAGVKSESEVAAIRAELEEAETRVREIINQPVTPRPASPNMRVAVYQPGWFHDGAEKPDFNTVDVRATQQLVYDQHEYVTSDLNPGVVFVGHELEFNPMTKFFYTDHSVPKKRLTEEEMLEVNRLYRIIGHDEQQLAPLEKH